MLCWFYLKKKKEKNVKFCGMGNCFWSVRFRKVNEETFFFILYFNTFRINVMCKWPGIE